MGCEGPEVTVDGVVSEVLQPGLLSDGNRSQWFAIVSQLTCLPVGNTQSSA